MPKYKCNLESVLKNKNMTKSKLADMVGLSGGAISRYINGTHIPNLAIAYDIAVALRTKLIDIWPRQK